ncbi:hypothetical protein LS280_001393, partial [Campylobacter jejuni]|nr:hypothetical protein [Campylobacter jejuni]
MNKNFNFNKHAYGGGDITSKESSLNSKKIVLSLATISFLASCANAALNSEIKTYDEANKNVKARSASVYSSQSGTSTSINTSQNNTHTISSTNNTLVIGSGGTITISNGGQQAVNFTQGSSTSTFKNQGTLIGGSNTASVNVGASSSGGATIETFENSGIIGNETSKFGITVWGKDGAKSTINNFTNSGTISSKGGEAIYFGNTNISSFANSGTIKSDGGYGVNIASGTSIKNFNNTGAIQGNNSLGIVHVQGEIETFINKGTMINTGKAEPSEYIYVSSGVYLFGGTIKTFTNEGLISGVMGVNLAQGSIENFTNKGTIESTSDHKNAAAINLMTIYSQASIIDNFTNEGTIKSNSNGILAEAGNKINTLINKGSIEVSLNGISFNDFSGVSGSGIKLGRIILEKGSSIKAGNNGINIDNDSSKPIEADAIEVQQGAKVEGDNAGIYLGGGKEINTQITIAGEVSGGAAGIVNEGIIGGSSSGDDDKKGGIIISGGSVSSSSGGSGIVNQGNGSIAGEIKVESGGSVEGGITNTGSGSISGNIVVESGGKLDSITNTSTSNTGISGSITNNSDNNLEISNSGNIGGKIESTGSADMVISNSNGGTISGGISSSGSGNTSISNSQGSTINNGITVSGSAQVEISNQGSVGKDKDGNTVTNNGSGSVGIKDWVVSTDKNTGKLETVVVGG